MPERPLVVVSDFISEPLDYERKILGDIAEVIAIEATDESQLCDIVDRATAIMVYHAISLSEKTIRSLKQCKLIVRCGVGYDNVDGQTARKMGIPLANVPDYGTEEVADSAIGMTLSLTRGIHFMNNRLQRSSGEWSYTQVSPLQRLRDKTFAIIGLGRIGTATALRAKALGFRVLFYDPYLPQGIDKAMGMKRADSLDELVREAHVLSLHCPLTEETSKIVDEKLLSKMPAGSYLVNTARGGLLMPETVLNAITSGHLAGAGIDVLPVEPPETDNVLITAWRDPNHPAHDRVIINPHSAFYCEQGLEEMRVKGSENCLRVLNGEEPVNVVN